jgi:hypothetical protein
VNYGDPSRTRRIGIAAAMCEMSQAEFIRASVDIQIEQMAQKDHWLGLMLAEQARKTRQ